MKILFFVLPALLLSSFNADAVPGLLHFKDKIFNKQSSLLVQNRKLTLTEDISATAQTTSEPHQCPGIAMGVTVNVDVRRRLMSFPTANAFICCEACENDGRCTIWRRNRSSSLCELFDAENASSIRLSTGLSDTGGNLENNS